MTPNGSNAARGRDSDQVVLLLTRLLFPASMFLLRLTALCESSGSALLLEGRV